MFNFWSLLQSGEVISILKYFSRSVMIFVLSKTILLIPIHFIYTLGVIACMIDLSDNIYLLKNARMFMASKFSGLINIPIYLKLFEAFPVLGYILPVISKPDQ